MPTKGSLAQAVSLAFGGEPAGSRKGQTYVGGSMPGQLAPSQTARNHGIPSLQPGGHPFLGGGSGLHGCPQPHGVIGRELGSTGWSGVERSLPPFQGGGGEQGFGSVMLSRGSFEPGIGHPGLDPSDTIKVAVRVRPLLDCERTDDPQETIQIDPEDVTAMKVMLQGPLGTKFCRDFHFHACLGQGASQDEVFERCSIYQLLNAALSGYKVTIMAYGQTGSGKTYTMSGKNFSEVVQGPNPAEPGIVIGAVDYLMRTMPTIQGVQYTLKASYLEIYNEAVFDLLANNNKSMSVKWDSGKGFHVPGLKIVECATFEAVQDAIAKGLKNRRVGSHELNLESSRGHTILTLYCESISETAGDPEFGAVKCGKVSFVDLAGSERLKDSRSTGGVLKETTNINKSLFNLGKVISALAERDTSPGSIIHVPYRDSTLTKLLMDSLGGSAFALMIACCSPAPAHVEETLSTLTYATRTKGIVNCPVIQYNPGDFELSALRSEVEHLREENCSLRDVLRRKDYKERRSQFEHSSMRSNLQGLKVSDDRDSDSSIPVPWMPTSIFSNPLAAENMMKIPPSSTEGNVKGARRTLYRSGSAPSLKAPGFSGFEKTSHHQSSPETPSDWAQCTPHRRYTFSGVSKSGGLQPNSVSRDYLRARLMDTQDILTQFSEENSRLAQDNERLRMTGGQFMNGNQVLFGEINMLKQKLLQLESTVMSGRKNSETRSIIWSQGNPSSFLEVKNNIGLAPAGDAQSHEGFSPHLQPPELSPSSLLPEEPHWDSQLCMPVKRESCREAGEGYRIQNYEHRHQSAQPIHAKTVDGISDHGFGPSVACLPERNTLSDLRSQQIPGAAKVAQEACNAPHVPSSGIGGVKISAVESPSAARKTTSTCPVTSEQPLQCVTAGRPPDAVHNKRSQGRIVANEEQLGLFLGTHPKKTEIAVENCILGSTVEAKSDHLPRFTNSPAPLPLMNNYQVQSQLLSPTMDAADHFLPRKYVAVNQQAPGATDTVSCHTISDSELISGHQSTFHHTPFYGRDTYTGNNTSGSYLPSPAPSRASYAAQYENNNLFNWKFASRNTPYQSQRF